MIKCNLTSCAYFECREDNNCVCHECVRDCEWYLKENSIQLKPITNETFDDIVQFNWKLKEEFNEFKTSIHKYNLSLKYEEIFKSRIELDKENIIEEFYDVIQSMLQLMIFEGLTLDEIIEGQEKHFEKLESRGWKFNE
nr:MAG TPA: Phosphoribosyl-ATP pyrophosphatase [Caudoviricetes sp.]